MDQEIVIDYVERLAEHAVDRDLDIALGNDIKHLSALVENMAYVYGPEIAGRCIMGLAEGLTETREFLDAGHNAFKANLALKRDLAQL